jgi:outer membrane protein assembly factor BamB
VKGRILRFAVVIVTAAGCIFYWYYLVRRPVPTSSKIPETKWTKYFESIDGFYTSPTVGTDGTLYIAGSKMYAMDPSNVSRWEYRVDLHDLIESGVFQDEAQNIYFSTVNKVYSLTSSGMKRWETTCGASPKTASSDQGGTFDGSTIYTTCGQSFSAFNKEDGTQLWSMPTLQRETSPVMLRDGVLAFVRDRRIFAADRAGNILWSYPRVSTSESGALDSRGAPLETYIDTPIAVGQDDTIYAGSQIGKFIALNTQGQVKWTYDNGNQMGFRMSPVIAADGTIVAVSVQDVVDAFSPDGTVKWTFHLPQTRNMSRHAAPLLGSDGTIYLLAEQRLVALSDQGKLRWDLPLQGTAMGSPALAPDGTLYIAMAEGTLYSVQTGSRGLLQSAWPKYQHDASNSGRSIGAGGK